MTSRLRTLLYHRIQPVQLSRHDLAPDLISATPDLFARHLRYLARFYSPVGAAEVLAALNGSHRLPRRAVLVTFDDGYRDFAEIAWPLLKQHNIPCVLFVSTGYATDPARVFWWDALWQLVSRTRRAKLQLAGLGWLALVSDEDRLRTCARISEWLKAHSPAARMRILDDLAQQLGVQPGLTEGPAVLSWPELRHLADDGLTVAPHGRWHELLDQVDQATLDDEITGARAEMVDQLGRCSPLFAYPNGNVDWRAVRALRQAHYAASFTIVAGMDVIPSAQPMLLRREQGRASLATLAVKLSLPVAAWRAARRPVLAA